MPSLSWRGSTGSPGGNLAGMTHSSAEELRRIRRAVDELPDAWHRAGTVEPAVLDALERNGRDLKHSIETGTGRTTLLLSHLSTDHIVFAKDDTGDGDSLSAVRLSPLLKSDNVTFVVGPTQRTLLSYEFDSPLHLAFLDGPHAYPFPDLEYWAVYPHIEAGGLLVIDDIQIPTIANMYSVLKADAMWDLVEVVHTTAFFRRTLSPAIDPYGEGWWLQGYNARSSVRHLPWQNRPGEIAKAALPDAAKNMFKKLRRRS